MLLHHSEIFIYKITDEDHILTLFEEINNKIGNNEYNLYANGQKIDIIDLINYNYLKLNYIIELHIIR